MQHLNEEQLVMHHYHDGDTPADAERHLAACAECRAQLVAISRVLALVDGLPIPERGEAYGSEVWTRLRWKLGSSKRRLRAWQASVAAAAMLALAFVSGIIWHSRSAAPTAPTASAHVATANVAPALQPASQTAAATTPGIPTDRVLLVVVSDHLDNSERILTELANADARHGLDVQSESKRAGELVATNRLYRQTALRQGDARIASLLSDIEPILTEIAHAGDKLSAQELASMQKRIESKGLLFKVRVISARAGGNSSAAPKGTNSL